MQVNLEQAEISGEWRGKVVDRDDPEQSRRVKVFVKPLHDGIAVSKLPWAIPATGDVGGMSSLEDDFGEGGVPELDSWVRVDFIKGDPKKPRWLGSAPAKDAVPDRFQGKEDQSFEKINQNSTSFEEGAQKGNYPESRGWVLNSGIVFELEDSNTPRILIFHPSGYRLEILDSGVKIEHVENDQQEVVVGNKKGHVGGDWTIQVNGKVDLDCSDVQIGDGQLEKLVKASGNLVSAINNHEHGGVKSGGSTTSGPTGTLVNPSNSDDATQQTQAS